MKLRTIFLFILFTTNAYALVNVEQDQILIYQNNDGSTLANNLKIYDNMELKGKPAFTIEKEKLIIGDKIISLKNPVSCKDLNSITFNCNESTFFVDFIKAQSRRVYLLVDQKNNDLATLKNKDKIYYFKLEKKDFKKSDWPEESQWRLILGEKAKLQLKEMVNEKTNLREFFKTFQACVKARDKKCISNLETKDIQSDKMFKYRAIADDPVLCKKFLDIWGDAFEDDMEYVLKDNVVVDSDVTWRNLEELFNLDNSKVEVGLGTSKFLGVDHIALSLKSDENLKCENNVNLQVRIKEILNDITGKKEWKINYFSTYSRKNYSK